MEVAILITSFNERDTLESCLKTCGYQTDALKSEGAYTFSIYVADGGSTDGTADMVEEKFPNVNFIKGHSGPRWNANLRIAWDKASESAPDFYLWLSRKISLKEGAISVMLENSERLRHRAVIAGSITSPDGTLVKGGRNKSVKLVEPDPVIPVPCTTFDGYIALIPKSVYAVLGNLDPFYTYRYADYDYGIRAKKAGITRVVAPGILAEGAAVDPVPVWRDSDYSLKERYRFLIGPEGRPPRELFRFDLRRSGFFPALGHLISVLVRVLFPKRKSKS